MIRGGGGRIGKNKGARKGFIGIRYEGESKCDGVLNLDRPRH